MKSINIMNARIITEDVFLLRKAKMIFEFLTGENCYTTDDLRDAYMAGKENRPFPIATDENAQPGNGNANITNATSSVNKIPVVRPPIVNLTHHSMDDVTKTISEINWEMGLRNPTDEPLF